MAQSESAAMLGGAAGDARLHVEVPGPSYHRDLIACQRACPVHTDARGYVRAIAAGDFEGAYLIARGPNPFASICGRICGAPCETACRRGLVPRVDADGVFYGTDRPVAIRALKRFACESFDAATTEEHLERVRAFAPEINVDADEMAALLRASLRGVLEPASGEKIGIVGAGPAGLSAAHDLALLGFRPVVFESEPVPAGMLYLGVPGYRLPRELIRQEIAVIEALGVEIRCNVTVGRDVNFADLRREHAAILIAVGAKRARGLGLPGERGPNVYGGVDFLRTVALNEPLPLGHDVLVIGGGNVAYDVARTVLRQAAFDAARTAARLPGMRRVRLASLETLEEMPADTVEIREGDEEGIERLNGWGPLEILRDTDGTIRGVELRRCIRVYDEQRRFAPIFEDSERQVLECDTVLLAAGQTPNLDFLQPGGEDVEEARPGWPRVDQETLKTTADGVFIAGDLAHGTRLLIDAVASGKKAARSIYTYVTGRKIETEALQAHIPQERWRREPGYEVQRRVELSVLSVAERLAAADASVEIGYDAKAAMQEAGRCLDCGVTPVFDATRCVLCGGCADVCPTLCLKLVSLEELELTDELRTTIVDELGADANLQENAAILKDEDRCIRCALCAMRCPVDAISMERVQFQTQWKVVA